jgi:hypothetical protein
MVTWPGYFLFEYLAPIIEFLDWWFRRELRPASDDRLVEGSRLLGAAA